MTRIVQIVNSTGGGAGHATVRLHTGLRRLGYDSMIVCGENSARAAPALTVTSLGPASHADTEDLALWQGLERGAIQNVRTAISNTAFNIGYPGHDLTQLREVAEADIIHMHWVCKLMSVRTIELLLNLGKPVFWTLHDYWPVTPGNHFPAGTRDHEMDGAGASQLFLDGGLGALLLADKKETFNRPNLHVVALSQAMKRNLEASTVFRGRDISVWYNGVDTEIFRPQLPAERLAMRNRLGIPEDSIALLIVAQSIQEKRKGFALLTQALQRLATAQARGEVAARHITIVMVGSHALPPPHQSMSTVRLDTVTKPEVMARIMDACDFLVHPATEEGFSLVILEAMASGLPVISFDNGGSPDIIVNGENGVLIPGRVEIDALMQAIAEKTAYPPQHWRGMRKRARATAEQYTIEAIAENMVDIYHRKGATVRPTLKQGAGLPPEIETSLPQVTRPLHLDVLPSNWLKKQRLPPGLRGMAYAAKADATGEDKTEQTAAAGRTPESGDSAALRVAQPAPEATSAAGVPPATAFNLSTLTALPPGAQIVILGVDGASPAPQAASAADVPLTTTEKTA